MFFLFGCSHKYVYVEGESLGGGIVASWEELDCKIVEQDEWGFSLGLEVRNIVVVEDSVKSSKLYKRRSLGRESVLPLLGVVIGVGGCLAGFNYGVFGNPILSEGFDNERMDRGCLISVASCAAGVGMVLAGPPGSSKRKDIKAMSNLVKGDTVCMDSESLSIRKIKISIEDSGFEKTYYTDEKGKIELEFAEILPEPTEVDSVLNIIIRYYELVDTVRVKRL